MEVSDDATVALGDEEVDVDRGCTASDSLGNSVPTGGLVDDGSSRGDAEEVLVNAREADGPDRDDRLDVGGCGLTHAHHAEIVPAGGPRGERDHHRRHDDFADQPG